jgi:hypothetical protein
VYQFEYYYDIPTYHTKRKRVAEWVLKQRKKRERERERERERVG